jgi:hypothetical protein
MSEVRPVVGSAGVLDLSPGGVLRRYHDLLGQHLRGRCVRCYPVLRRGQLSWTSDALLPGKSEGPPTGIPAGQRPF